MTDSHESKSSRSSSLDSSLSSVDETLALIRMRRNPNISPATLEEARASVLGARQWTSGPSNVNKDMDMRIRQLVMGGAPWHLISEALRAEYLSSPTAQSAARLLEISFVQASPAETLGSFSQIMARKAYDFYWLLHPCVRDFLLENADASLIEPLYWILAQERSASKLTDLEVLFLFLRVSESREKAAWIYFRRNSQRMFSCLSERNRFNCSRDQFVLKVGELALLLGYEEEARAIMNEIPRASAERDKALNVLLQHESAILEQSANGYVKQLELVAAWEERVRLIDGFCNAVRSNGGLRDPNRGALNEVMKTLLQWIPRSPEGWRAVGELIVRNRDLSDMVPALFQTLYDNACVYHPDAMDQALWFAAVQLQPETPEDAYLSGLGWLHYFILNPRRKDAALWTAQKMVDFANTNLPVLLPWSWHELVRAALIFAERAQQILERDRKRIVAALRVSIDGANSSAEVIQQYLTSSDAPSVEIIDSMANDAWQQKKFQSFINLSVRRASITFYRTTVLQKLWYAAAHQGDHDLAWRLASVLAARESLDSKIKPSWGISGERRSVYAPTPLSNVDIEQMLGDFPRNSRRVLHSLFQLGDRISELATYIRRDALVERPTLPAISSTEKAILKSLSESKLGLSETGKTVFEATVIVDLPEDIVGLIQSPESNPWIFANRAIFERFGMQTWGFRHKTLADLTTSVLPMIGSTSGRNVTAKVGKWLVSLSPHQRAAWGELASGLSEISETEFSQDLMQFVMRLAVMLYPSHYEALRSLQKSRVSLATLRGLESFILGPTYSEFRKRASIGSRVVIPKILVTDEFNAIDT